VELRVLAQIALEFTGVMLGAPPKRVNARSVFLGLLGGPD
jgi:hypothetical protein